MATRAANRRARAAEFEAASKAVQEATAAPTAPVPAAPTAEELERAERAKDEAWRAAEELKSVLSRITALFSGCSQEAWITRAARNVGIEVPEWANWEVSTFEVRLNHCSELSWGLSAEARIAIERRYGGDFSVTANVNLASNTGSPAEVLARLALHRDVAEKAAQAQMMLTHWMGSRQEHAIKAVLTVLGEELTGIKDDVRAAALEEKV